MDDNANLEGLLKLQLLTSGQLVALLELLEQKQLLTRNDRARIKERGEAITKAVAKSAQQQGGRNATSRV